MKKIGLVISALMICAIAHCQTLSPLANKKGLWGYVNTKGKYVIKAQFEEAAPFENGIAVVRFDGKCGIIGADGSEIVPFEYSKIEPSEKANFFVGKKESSQMVTVLNPLAQVKDEYDEINLDRRTGVLIPVWKNGLLGYIDADGKPLLVPSYDEVGPFNINGIAAARKEGKYGLVKNTDGKGITGFIYSRILSLKDIFLLEKGDDLFDVGTSAGDVVVEDASEVRPIGKDILVIKDGEFSLYSGSLTERFSGYDSIVENNGILTLVKNGVTNRYDTANGKMAFVDNGKEIWTPEMAVSISKEGNMYIWKDTYKKDHYITAAGKMLFANFSSAKMISPKCFIVEDSHGSYVFDDMEKQIAGPFDRVYPMDAEHVLVLKNTNRGRLGAMLYTKTGKMLTDFVFSGLGVEYDGRVTCNSGQVVASGEKVFVLIGRPYEDVYVAVDATTKKSGLFNAKTMKVVIPAKFDEMDSWDDLGNVATIIGGKFGMVSYKGTTVLSNAWLNQPVRINNTKQYYAIYDNYGGAFYMDAKGNKVSRAAVEKATYEFERENQWGTF